MREGMMKIGVAGRVKIHVARMMRRKPGAKIIDNAETAMAPHLRHTQRASDAAAAPALS